MYLKYLVVLYYSFLVVRCSLINYIDFARSLHEAERRSSHGHNTLERRANAHPFAFPRYPSNLYNLNSVPENSLRSNYKKQPKVLGSYRPKNVGLRTNYKNRHRLLLRPHKNVNRYIPRVGGLHPGHALLKPKGQTLNSAAKYPKDNTNHLVYGNPENFGIRYNQTRERLWNTGFRKMNDDVLEDVVMEAILKLKQYQESQGRKK